MRAAIYNPYLDTVGGGERYTMTVAHILKKHDWDVEVAWNNPKIVGWLEERLGTDLSGIEVVSDIDRGAGYDLVFWLSDGSIPALLAKKNVLHFQTPFHNVGGKALFNRLKFTKIHEIICNSKFTKKFIDREYGVKSKVIYPPVSVAQFKAGKKENIILSVGRFSQLQQEKRQDVLLDVFKKMHDGGLRDWRLVLAGGSDVGRTDFVDKLKSTAQGYPIDILENLPFSEIKKFYAKAKIFWSATGFGTDEEKEPEKVEHFGMVVVESMAAGCVPIILDKGGHKEIVRHKVDGFLWSSTNELADVTLTLIKDAKKSKKIAEEAQKKSKKFSEKRFEREFLQVIS